jgi:hypothetical protein
MQHWTICRYECWLLLTMLLFLSLLWVGACCYLDLSHNELVGTLPLEYAELDNLQVRGWVVIFNMLLVTIVARNVSFQPKRFVLKRV